MGLDVALGVIILIAAIRGWLQGFLYQVIRIGGLIACVYLAAPVRDQAKPHVAAYLPSIQPDLIDRLLWWVSASLAYIVIVGATTLALKITRRPEMPGMLPQRSRNDQFAGFLLGIAKGGLIAAFLVGALGAFGMKQIETISWADQQARTSQALRWDQQYHPAAKIWESVPVRHFVNHIQRMGLEGPSDTPAADDAGSTAEDRPVVQTARRGSGDGQGRKATRAEDPPAAPAPVPAPNTTKARPTAREVEIEKAVDGVKAALDAVAKPK